MEILFCDLCNESVPEADVAAGNAYYRKGRLICVDCDSAMGGGGSENDLVGASAATPPGGLRVPDAWPAGGSRSGEGSAGPAQPARTEAPAPARAGAGGVLVGLVALAFAALGFSMVLERIDGVGGDLAGARRDLEDEVRAARVEHDLHVAALPGLLEAKATEVRASEQAARDGLRDTIEALRVDLAAAQAREQESAQALGRLRDDLDQRETERRGREEGLRTDIANLEAEVRFFSDRMIELEETLRAVSARGPVAAAPGGALPGGAPGAPTTKPWDGLLSDLVHDNAGIRLDAIYALGETKDPDVVPHLIPMLQDVDLFVRMATARMLEDLDARAAVPALIDSLEDSQSAVREAAMVALHKITAKNFGFEPVASAAERSKRVKSWRDWWKKNGDEFLTGS